MSERVEVHEHGPNVFSVDLTEGTTSTHHLVEVPEELRIHLGIGDDVGAQEALVRESFEFLLEREPATSILREFPLDEISRYFPEYLDEIRDRLSG
jgi:hypothetical protein